jgi:hypothetical protein
MPRFPSETILRFHAAITEAARAEVWTQAAAFAFSTGDLARP